MIFLTLLIVLYFLPTLIASHRGHSTLGVTLVNLLIGWTLIGWLALLLWALLSRPRIAWYPVPYGYRVPVGVPVQRPY